MSRPSPERVLRGYLAAADARDLDGLDRWLAADVVVHGGGGTRHGLQAHRDGWAAAHAGLAGLHHVVHAVLVQGDTAAARVTVTGRHEGDFLGLPATGRELRVDGALFARTRSGKVVELWELVDSGAGLQQLGLLADQALAP